MVGVESKFWDVFRITGYLVTFQIACKMTKMLMFKLFSISFSKGIVAIVHVIGKK